MTTMEQDYSATVATKVPELEDLALKQGKVAEAIEALYALEKQTRQAGDAPSTSKIAIAIVKLCFTRKDWKALNENLVLLSKRRAQLKQAIVAIVQEAMTYLDKVDHAVKMELIDTLRTITEGKIFVEVERARITRILAKIKEDEGKISEAATILQEVQVETFGAMDKKEKIDFLLEQVRLCLDKKDYIRAQILSNKINRKSLQDREFQELKLRFYELMIRYYAHEGQYLDIYRSYQAIYDTPVIQENEEKWKHNFKLMAMFLVLSPHNHEQEDFLHRVYEDKKLAQIPTYKALLKYFLTLELIRWAKLREMYLAEFNQYPFFSGESGAKTWADFQKRVVEHNIRVISQTYSRITSKRLAELLDLPEADTEKYLSEQVVAKAMYAKIDRPKSIISFVKPKDPSEILNDWAGNINSLLDLLEKNSHLIHRERMVHGKA